MTEQNWPLIVFYDGACPLCAREMRHYRTLDIHRRMHLVDIAAPTFEPARFGFTLDQLNRAMHVKTADGRVFKRAAAFVKIWQALPPRWWTRLLITLLRIPGMLLIANLFYRAFAANRYRLTGRCQSGACELPGK